MDDCMLVGNELRRLMGKIADMGTQSDVNAEWLPFGKTDVNEGIVGSCALRDIWLRDSIISGEAADSIQRASTVDMVG
jgi:hypothetical protein